MQNDLFLFSGGKDSSAALWMLKDRWDTIDVIHIDTGGHFPDFDDYIKEWEERLPHFYRIKTDSRKWIELNGWPVDFIPAESTDWWQSASDTTAPKLTLFGNCCHANLWDPLCAMIYLGGYKKVIRGNKKSDELAYPRTLTETANFPYRGQNNVVAVEYPIWELTDEQVFEYLQTYGIPPGYKSGHAGNGDCRFCTGYTFHGPHHLERLAEEYPEEFKPVRKVIQFMAAIPNRYKEIGDL